jgi:hypothetical protein
MTVERLHERGRALGAWIDAGGSTSRLIKLDCRVRRGECSDWPGRSAEEPERRGVDAQRKGDGR